jgi:NAD(P)-dependent dehydrogenase (short-subunit alcohol dehydrogenase family)
VLRNRVILVTGGATGIGFVIAQGLARQGAELIVTGATQGQIDDAVARLGYYATGVSADLSKVADVEALFSRVRASHGRLDVLVVTTGAQCDLPLGRITESAFDQMFNANVKAVTFTVQAARSMMGDGGSIVIIGSQAPTDQGEGTSLCRAAKSALHSLIEEWTTDLREIGVRVNLLSASSATAPIGSKNATARGEHFFCTLENHWSFQLNGSQREIVGAATFLASDTSRYLNGVELVTNRQKI